MRTSQPSEIEQNPPVAASFWVPMLIFSLAATICLLVLNGDEAALVLSQGILPGNDDYLRLVQIRDWMAGAAWFDVTQDRLGDTGTVMHWSRLVDVPLTTLIRLLEMVPMIESPERIALIVWPPFLYGVLAVTLMQISGILLPGRDPLMIGALITINLFGFSQFEPGRIDHHNLQIVFMALAMLGSILPHATRGGWIAGIACGLSVMIGGEAFGIIALIALGIGIEWIVRADGTRLARFGLGFAISSLIGMVLTVPPGLYRTAMCDQVSIAYIAPIAVAGFGAVLVVWTASGRGWRVRALSAGILGLASAATLLGIEPGCIAGPLGSMPDDLVQRWLPQIIEARPLLAHLEKSEFAWVSFIAMPLIALGGATWFILRSHDTQQRGRSAMIALPLLGSFAMAFAQVRLGQFTQALMPPLLVLGIIALASWLSSLNKKAVIAMALVSLGLAGTAAVRQEAKEAPETTSESGDTAKNCEPTELWPKLAALPTGRILNDMNLGAPTLAFTSHTVMSGPYHRSEVAVRDGLALYGEVPTVIRALTKARGIQYVMLCEAEARIEVANSANPSGFLAQIGAGKRPDWLIPLFKVDSVGVYRVE